MGWFGCRGGAGADAWQERGWYQRPRRRTAARLRPAHDQPNVTLLLPPVLGRIRSRLRSGLGQGAKPTGPQWLSGYTGQTTAELLALEGVFRTDSIVLAFEQALQTKASRVGLPSLTYAERVVLAVEALEREVNNGGFSQLFLNSPEQVPTVVSSLKAIGATGVAEIAEAAIGALGIKGKVTAKAVETAINHEDEDDVMDERLNQLDERYYQTAGDLADPLLAFIKTNLDQIVVP